jgi:hypothetical protein
VKVLLITALVLAVTALLGVGVTPFASDGSIKELEAFQRADGDTRAAYSAAVSHRDLFTSLPCYCGCVRLLEPHRHLLDCFITPDGALESHALGCLVCVDIALEAVAESERGLSTAAIRALIDEKFALAGPPTETPLP